MRFPRSIMIQGPSSPHFYSFTDGQKRFPYENSPKGLKNRKITLISGKEEKQVKNNFGESLRSSKE